MYSSCYLKEINHSRYVQKNVLFHFLFLILLDISQRDYFQQPGYTLTHLWQILPGTYPSELLQFLLNLPKWINFAPTLSYVFLSRGSTGATRYTGMHECEFHTGNIGETQAHFRTHVTMQQFIIQTVNINFHRP